MDTLVKKKKTHRGFTNLHKVIKIVLKVGSKWLGRKLLRSWYETMNTVLLKHPEVRFRLKRGHCKSSPRQEQLDARSVL